MLTEGVSPGIPANLADVRNPQAYLLRVASHAVSEWRDHQPPQEAFEPVEEGDLADEGGPELILEAGTGSLQTRCILELSPVISPIMPNHA